MSIRARLIAWSALTLLVLVAVVGAVTWIGYSRVVRQAIDGELHARAMDVLAGPVGVGGSVGDVADPAWAGIFAAVFAPDGSVVARSQGTPAALQSMPLGDHTVHLGTAGTAYAVDAIAGPGDRVVVAGKPLGALDARLDWVAGSVVLSGLLLVGGAILGGWVLAGRALAPVDAMVRRARAIGSDAALDVRLPVSPRDDELDRLARTLNDSLDRVAATVERERRFIAAASHDLRTPIAALRVELELAATGERDPDRLVAAIEAAHGDAVRLGSLASDLLELAEAAPAGRELRLEPVDVAIVADTVVARVRPLADTRGVTLSVSAPGRRAWVDRVRLEQAVANLLANAVAASPSPGEVSVRVDLRTGGDGGPATLEIDVLDEGPGIPAALRDRLFQPFSHPPGGAAPGSGTGLGLATAAAAVAAQGGWIRYRDRPSGGAWFTISLPAGPRGAPTPGPSTRARSAPR